MTEETSKIINIIPDEENGYKIKNVLVDGVSQGPIESYKFEDIKQDHTLHAEFEIKTYTISPSAGENGKIYPENDVTIEWGNNKTFFIQPNENYVVSSLIVDGISVEVKTEHTFENVKENHTISAGFSLMEDNITTESGDPLLTENNKYILK